MSSIPGSGRFPRVGNGNPLQCSCLENSMDRGAWQATVPVVAESDMAKHAHTHTTMCQVLRSNEQDKCGSCIHREGILMRGKVRKQDKYVKQWWILPRNIKQGWVIRCRMGKWGYLRLHWEGIVENVCLITAICFIITSADAFLGLWLEGIGTAVKGVGLCHPNCLLLSLPILLNCLTWFPKHSSPILHRTRLSTFLALHLMPKAQTFCTLVAN